MKLLAKVLCCAIAVCVMFSFTRFTEADEGNVSDGKTIAEAGELPVVGSEDNLKLLLNKMDTYNERFLDGNTMKAMNEGTVKSAAQPEAKDKEASSAGGVSDYSSTNVQVEGVDEADIVKTDGEYIYQVNNGRIIIAKAYPAEEMKISSSLSFTDSNFSPEEMYLHKQYLVVIGSHRTNIPLYKQQSESNTDILPIYGNTDVLTKVIIYDISDKENPKIKREVEIGGYYLSSRKVGSSLYLVSNKHLNIYYIQNKHGNYNPLPFYKDTAAGDDTFYIDYGKIRYFPECSRPDYLIEAGVNLDKLGEKADVKAYLGAGQNIYASQENLYVAAAGSRSYDKTDLSYAERKNSALLKAPAESVLSECYTGIYKFALDDGKMVYSARGEVPGTILNQFSMDENGKYFRIATTNGDTWRNDEYTSKNNLYVLDEKLNIKGKIEDIAPGEKIYSVRFMGDRAYMVTFKTVDPLFVLDLKDAANPKILGALKIPGYSDYIHPYDENHIIGFGKDTVEIKGNAYYQGMKVAVFDVTDVANPKEMFVEKIGDRGTDSEILRNHKALLFNKEKNLLAFPVTLMEKADENGEENGKNDMQYGQFTFQGAYVYQVDLSSGFKLKGRITHLSSQDYLKSGESWYDSNKNIERVLYINDILYTLSNGMIKANQISDLSEKNSLVIQ